MSDDNSVSVSSYASNPNSVVSSKSFARVSGASSAGVAIRMQLAAKEQRQVVVSKIAMIVLLVIVAIVLCTVTFMFVRDEETKDFHKQFETHASELVLVSTENVQSSFLAIETLSTSVTSYSKDMGLAWPNVTVGNYAARALLTMEAAGQGLLTLAPFVSFDQRLGYEEYARGEVLEQLQEVFDYTGTGQNATELELFDVIAYSNTTTFEQSIEPYEGEDVQSEYLCVWQASKVIPQFVLNNILRVPSIAGAAAQVQLTKKPKVSFFQGQTSSQAQVMQPIFQDIYLEEDSDKREVVGVLWMISSWNGFFKNILSENVIGPRLVMESSCGFVETYQIMGPEAEFIGYGDFHDSKYDDMELLADFFRFDEDGKEYPEDLCMDHITLRMYPTDEMKDSVTTSRPIIYASGVAIVFVFTWMMFMVYDWTVRHRQERVMQRVEAQDKIVSNLFPATIRDRLYGIGDKLAGFDDGYSTTSSHNQHACGDVNGPDIFGSRPIADLFLETTVLFADIAGFTAWSSAREPSQVFILLENVYGAFDKLSHRRGVFKVETIGDCYVAVAGLPTPNKDHAVTMAKFARDCSRKMGAVTAKMEILLGPDTGDLDIRIGLHSGQVTAGVLRGERSRFQLFGDTVNVAARMESAGERGRIHLSGVTAELIKASGYSKWIKPRGEILVRGKGSMSTYWLETHAESDLRHERTRKAHALEYLDAKTLSTLDADTTEERSQGSEEEDDLLGEDEYERGISMSKKDRLVEWNVEILSGLLKRNLAARQKHPKSLQGIESGLKRHDTVLEEFAEIISLPKVTLDDLKIRKDPSFIMLDANIINQLRSLIAMFADMYRSNAFHSFEHASHVTASVAKLLSRIVTSDSTQQTHGPSDIDDTDIAGHSYGITNDPLTQFAVVFSAIIHDIDHQGVPNAQLIREDNPMATKYKGKSLAEQNSVDLAWDILMKAEFTDLRSCIYSDESELKRFRQLLVNMVMATDIADKELGALRKARWNEAFDPKPNQKDSPSLAMNRKATIVLEHLIQASDVSHTMQHWHVYKKWNQKYFNECYHAWKIGRAEKDPSLEWYQGEIGFFKYYVLPLAKKLDSCGVFGVSSHEYLNYATSNMDEWIRTGEVVVSEFVASYNQSHNDDKGHVRQLS